MLLRALFLWSVVVSCDSVTVACSEADAEILCENLGYNTSAIACVKELVGSEWFLSVGTCKYAYDVSCTLGDAEAWCPDQGYNIVANGCAKQLSGSSFALVPGSCAYDYFLDCSPSEVQQWCTVLENSLLGTQCKKKHDGVGYVFDGCTCAHPQVWGGMHCNVSECGGGASPQAVPPLGWACECDNGPGFIKPECIDLRCPVADGEGVECGGEFVFRHRGSSSVGDARLEFPYGAPQLGISTPSYGGIGTACDRSTGQCRCLPQLYNDPVADGTCVPLFDSTDNIASITTQDPSKLFPTETGVLFTCQGGFSGSMCEVPPVGPTIRPTTTPTMTPTTTTPTTAPTTTTPTTMTPTAVPTQTTGAPGTQTPTTTPTASPPTTPVVSGASGWDPALPIAVVVVLCVCGIR